MPSATEPAKDSSSATSIAEEKDSQRGTLLVIGAAILWGTTGTAQALAPAGAQPGSVGALRLLVGGLGLLIWAALRGMLSGSLRGRKRLPVLPVLMAGLFLALYQVSFFAGVARAGVAIGTIVGIGSSPIFAGVLGLALRGEKPGWRWAIATALALVGCAILMGVSPASQVNVLGILLALAAGMAYALYTLSIKNLLEVGNPDAVMAWAFTVAAILLSPLLLTSDLSWTMTWTGAAVILHLGLLATTLSYILFARGLKTMATAKAVSLTLAEPATAGVLGVALLGESLTPTSLVGILLVFAGLALMSVRSRLPRSR